jgi:hypothetical protein
LESSKCDQTFSSNLTSVFHLEKDLGHKQRNFKGTVLRDFRLQVF